MRTDQAQVDKFNCEGVSKNKITKKHDQYDPVGVTGDRQGWQRLPETGLMVICDDVMSLTKEFWILAKRLYYWNYRMSTNRCISTNCTCQVMFYTSKTPRDYGDVTTICYIIVTLEAYKYR